MEKNKESMLVDEAFGIPGEAKKNASWASNLTHESLFTAKYPTRSSILEEIHRKFPKDTRRAIYWAYVIGETRSQVGGALNSVLNGKI